MAFVTGTSHGFLRGGYRRPEVMSRSRSSNVVRCATEIAGRNGVRAWPLRERLSVEATVWNEQGEQVSLVRTLEKLVVDPQGGNIPVVVVFLRHYGCPLCEELLKTFTSLDSELAVVAAVGNGTFQQARTLKELVRFPGPVFSDPERKVYGALEMRKGMMSTFNVDGAKSAISSVARGNQLRLGLIPTDPFQQGGVLVLDKDANVVLFHRDEFAGDHIELVVLKQALKSMSAATPRNNS